MYEVLHYLTPEGVDVFEVWLTSLTDLKAVARILARIDRVRAGNLGDCKPVGEGVWELRIDHGPGYRVYYALAGKQIILLLTGGDKRRQAADIARAINFWNDFNDRNDNP